MTRTTASVLRHNAHVQWGDLILDCADKKPPKANVVTMRRAAA